MMLAISLSEREFSELSKKNPVENWAAIRIVSQMSDLLETSHDFNSQFTDICVVQFTDIDKPIKDEGVLYQPYSKDNHNQIINFVEKNKHVDKLFVHCAAGICRSAGVVVGLAQTFNWIAPKHGINGKSKVLPYHNVVSYYEPHNKPWKEETL